MNIVHAELARTILLDVIKQKRPYYHAHWVTDDTSPFDCNTAACAAGWIIRDPVVRARGLTLHADGYPLYEGLEEYQALAGFFDLTEGEALWLFGPDSYGVSSIRVTAEMVLARLEHLMADENQTPTIPLSAA